MAINRDRKSPYQGLTPFDEQDAAYFFGREKDSRLIAADLFASPVTVLYGASGVGKSSVLRAGVAPLLRLRSDLILIVFSGWQSGPLDRLKTAVADAVLATSPPNEAQKHATALSDLKRRELASYLSGCAQLSGRRLMVILDQFEEYSLYNPEDDDFGRQFPAAALIGDLSASFLISLREDSVARLDRFEGRIPFLFDNFRRISHLDATQGRAAIERPIAKYREAFPTGDDSPSAIEPRLVERVLEEVRTGRLKGAETLGRGSIRSESSDARIETPYLQLVMTRLWEEERRERSGVIRLQTLNRLGGSENIVQNHLDAVMSGLTDAERDVAAAVFQQLVTPSGTKIAHSVRDLASIAGIDRKELNGVMQTLSAGTDRILRPIPPLREQPDEPRFEIFHDRLSSAVLDWRVKYLAEKELTAARRLELDRRRMQTAAVIDEGGEPRAAPVARPVAVPEIIAPLLQGRELVVVIGSGVSSSARAEGERWTPGARFMPTASELATVLAHEVDYGPDHLGGSALAEVASYYTVVAGRELLGDRLTQVLGTNLEPTATHRLLARVAQESPVVILTTAWDTMMETALADAGVSYELVIDQVRDRFTVLWQRPGGETLSVAPDELQWSPSTSCLYKIFGSLGSEDTDPERCIITEEEEMELFTRFSSGQLPPPSIVDALSSSHVLFLGMSLASWTQRLLVSSLRRRQGQRRGWTVALNVSRVDEMRWGNAEIEVLNMNVRSFTEDLEARLWPAR